MRWVIGGLMVAMVACGGNGADGDETSGVGGGGADGSGSTSTGTGASSSSGAGGDGASGGGGGGGPLPCGTVATFEDGATPQTQIHVAVSGSDGSGDGSAGSPFATVGRAAQDAAAGTAIVMHAGTYAGGASIEQLAGTAEAPIWIGGAAGEAKPVLVGGQNGLRLSRVRYLIVHDLELEGGEFNGINCDDGSAYDDADATRYIVFRDLDIHDVGSNGNQDCLKLSGLDDFFVLDSTFARCGGGDAGSGIDHVGCHDGVIVGNHFEATSGNGVQCKGGSTNILVQGNRFVDAGHRAVNMGGSTGFEFFRPSLDPVGANAEARDIRVIANVIEGGVAALGFVGCVDCIAANNTIVDPERWVFRILQETATSSGGYTFLPAQNGTVTNNIVYFTASGLSTHVNVGGDTDPDGFTFVNNLWFAHDAPGSSTPSLPVTEQGAIIGEDPLFVGGGDFSITANSPAAGAGSTLAALGGDYDGACYASPPSVGAYEIPGGM